MQKAQEAAFCRRRTGGKPRCEPGVSKVRRKEKIQSLPNSAAFLKQYKFGSRLQQGTNFYLLIFAFLNLSLGLAWWRSG